MLVLTLLVYNGGGWYLYEVSRAQAETELGKHLIAIGRTAALELREERIPILGLADPDTGLNPPVDWDGFAEQVDALRRRLALTRVVNDLRSVSVVDRNALVLVDTDERFPPETPLPALDATLIETAIAETTSTLSPYYRFEERDYMRCFTPLLNKDGRPFAVLSVSAGREYFKDLHRTRFYLLLISSVGSVLLAGVAVVVYGFFVNAVKAEQTMADSDRLQSLGTMAAGIAHEIRNPLGIIRAISEELEEDLKGDDESQELARDITAEVERLNSMVSQFLTFARPGSAGAEAEAFDLALVLSDMADLVRKGIENEHVLLECELDGTPSALRMDEKSIRQVLLNVLLNAREAVGDEGLISVRLDRAGQFARIRVMDNGSGIDPKQANHVFDPFFTTKPSGTGLGLSISRNIVVRYGGEIRLVSGIGRGTTVTIMLPLSRA